MNETIQIEVSCRDTASFAMQQNHVPVLRELSVKNCSETEVRALTVTIATDPGIADEWTAKIDSIMPSQRHTLRSVDLHLSASKLFELTERIEGAMIITVSDASGLLARETRGLSFLSFDEWSGASTFPEFLAAFVTPNHPYVTEIIIKAGALLAEWTGSPSFTGYQSKNPNNVKKQMAAIYGALQQERINYCTPPASFEVNGQKVRLGGTIREQKLGACLDLSLLYASCLEATGLHPMVVIVKEHAFAGCWLEDESFAECVQDDVSALTKRVAPGINEICVVETTAFTSEHGMDFERAVSAAENRLRTADDFVYLVDVERARGSGIRPIPQKREDGSFSYDAGGKSPALAPVTGAPEELEYPGTVRHVDSIEFTKQQMWERRLLDLSLRNPLLNFRVTRNSVQLLVNSLHDLEDALSDGEEFQILQKPQDMANSPRDNKIYESENNESIWNTLIKSEFRNHRIRTYLDESALGASISQLYRSAKVSMEENGANTLYLALGFLRWYESDVSEKPRHAPLVMIPVDIIRKSAQRGYVFRLRDEEPQFNVTLLEMLRMNFGINATGLDPLPEDEHGVDVKLVFQTVRRLVLGKPRWDVEELAFMGIFSFTRFIMWNDIRNRVDDLKRNKVVKSLISGQLEWAPDAAFLTPEALDSAVTPPELAVPISADSSQLAAIHAAGKGRSFVLHGPPGTGKSQTITNIIANALYHGKSVLFVAEKMAALTVVDKRLTAIGIGDFCIELHSNKARKKDVLGQLERALNAGRIKPPQRYADEADAILALRQELNAAVNQLHMPRPAGFSLYDAISRMEEHAGSPDCMAFTDAQLDALSPRQLGVWEDLCAMASAAGSACGGAYGHPLREFRSPHYSQNGKARIEAELGEFHAGLSALDAIAKQVGPALSLGEIKTHGQFAALTELCSVLSNAFRVPANLLMFGDLPMHYERIAAVCASGRRRDAAKAELSAAFSEQLLGIDAQTATLMWNKAEASWFLPKMTGKAKIAKSVKLYALDAKSYNKAETPRYLGLVSEYRQNDAIVAASAQLLHSLYGMLFNGGSCNWQVIEQLAAFAVNLQNLIGRAAPDRQGRDAAIRTLSEALDRGFDTFVPANRYIWSELSGCMKKLSGLESSLSAQFGAPFGQWHSRSDWIASMSEMTSRWRMNLNGLRDYCGYLQIRAGLDEQGLQTAYAALENGLVGEAGLVGAFVKCLSKAYAIRIIDNTPVLSAFRGSLFSQKIEKFKELNSKYEALTRQELAARLSAQVPLLSAGVSGSSEIGILQRAIKSGGRMTPIRKLFESIPNLLRKLCPCMLMSPISVAQYLDAGYPAFDLVVFDEASQLPTSEAVGAIARGSELIVVGDPKQLPPTSFFTSIREDDENFEKEDLESVLDDCLALSMPQEHLLWHYRSRHESLIAFSNRNYYDNKLFTYPSPDNMVSRVRLIPVEGYYDRGKSKQNKAEAEAIVDEVMRRLSDPALRKRSIGVVTFSSVQQNLIADMLEAEFSKNPALDEYANNAEEPVFVKNLENVQGDERDVILFSVGYGPDEQGRVTLNFGPLNREGGWRRLNVAVSRARYEMLVFSALKPEQIDLNRTRSDGLSGLKSFLEFAARGVAALPEVNSEKAPSRGVEEAIAEKIREAGYAVETGIGCSGYHVDIGVAHPEKENAYALGVLCDSANYYNGGTALDRNSTQEAVLKGLGWNLCRVWTLDWWENPEQELSRVLSCISSAIAENELTAEDGAAAGDGDGAFGCAAAWNGGASGAQPPAFERIEYPAPGESLKVYEPARLLAVAGYMGNSDYFASYESTRTIKQQIEYVLKVEAPVARDLLCKRVLEAWGISRMGARIGRRFDELLSVMRVPVTRSGDSVFCWVVDEAPRYDEFRVPSSDEKSRRSIEHIPPEELASAVKHILDLQIGLPREDLEREVSRIFGFARCTEAMQKSIRAGIDIAVERNWAAVSGDRLVAPSH